MFVLSLLILSLSIKRFFSIGSFSLSGLVLKSILNERGVIGRNETPENCPILVSVGVKFSSILSTEVFKELFSGIPKIKIELFAAEKRQNI